MYMYLAVLNIHAIQCVCICTCMYNMYAYLCPVLYSMYSMCAYLCPVLYSMYSMCAYLCPVLYSMYSMCIISHRDKANANNNTQRQLRRAASGGTRTRDVLHSRQTLYQLSHRGSSAGQAEYLKFIQGKCVSPLINRGTHVTCTCALCSREPCLLNIFPVLISTGTRCTETSPLPRGHS